MPEFLEKILARKKKRMEEQREIFPLPRLERLLAEAPPLRDPFASLLRKENGAIPIIAELKRKSPSAGELRPGLSPAAYAKIYQRAGARAISVLCEQDHFGGSLEDLKETKTQCDLPVLCKDFILSTFQVVLGRIYGADLILLIVSALDPKKLQELFLLTRELGMTPLVEIHDQAELEITLESGARLIGINNRNLDTLETSLDTTRKLLPLIPKDHIVISESGFSSRAELEEFQALGVQAFLIGGSILAAENPEQKIRELVYGQG